jgi:hypothetical protein
MKLHESTNTSKMKVMQLYQTYACCCCRSVFEVLDSGRLVNIRDAHVDLSLATSYLQQGDMRLEKMQKEDGAVDVKVGDSVQVRALND